VTRRYGKYRPCGAGLGVLWGGLLLGLLGVLLLQWTRHEYAASAVPSQTLWRFLRDTPLTPPGWLQIAATVSPFIGWLGLLAIQEWVDRQFGAVTSQRSSRDCPRRGPLWLAPFAVVLLACLLSGVLIWDAPAAGARGVLAMLAIAAWAVVWGRRSMQGVMRFPRFLKVRADLAAIQPVDE
jgi:quinol-cytochrome oxidoreductase complex cytochrome b subunit